MPFFSVPASKAACGDTSAVKHRLSAHLGLSPALHLVLMMHVHWAWSRSRVCLMAMLPDAVKKRQGLPATAHVQASQYSLQYVAWLVFPWVWGMAGLWVGPQGLCSHPS